MDRKEMEKAAYKTIKANDISHGDRVSSKTSRNPVYRATLETPSGKMTVAAKHCINFHEEEVLILARLKHNNIIKFLGVVIPKTIQENHIIVTEFAEQGSLYDVIREHRDKCPEFMQSRWMKYAQDGARALQFIHNSKYRHGDVKSPNFLITSNDTLKICDFGLSRKCVSTTSTNTNKGSWPWMAPEVFGSVHDPQNITKPCITIKSDVFSYGIVMWEMISCQVPHFDKEFMSIYKEVVEKGERLHIPSHCPKHQQMSKLLNECWLADHTKRPTMDEVLEVLEGLNDTSIGRRGSIRKRQLDPVEDDGIHAPSEKKHKAFKPNELSHALMPTPQQNLESLSSQQPVDLKTFQKLDRSVYTCNGCNHHVETIYYCTVCEKRKKIYVSDTSEEECTQCRRLSTEMKQIKKENQQLRELNIELQKNLLAKLEGVQGACTMQEKRTITKAHSNAPVLLQSSPAEDKNASDNTYSLDPG